MEETAKKIHNIVKEVFGQDSEVLFFNGTYVIRVDMGSKMWSTAIPTGGGLEEYQIRASMQEFKAQILRHLIGG